MSAAVLFLARVQGALATAPDRRAVAARHQRTLLLHRRAAQMVRAAGRALKVEDMAEAGRLLKLAKAALELTGMPACDSLDLGVSTYETRGNASG